jgi:hypothetical protein
MVGIDVARDPGKKESDVACIEPSADAGMISACRPQISYEAEAATAL